MTTQEGKCVIQVTLEPFARLLGSDVLVTVGQVCSLIISTLGCLLVFSSYLFRHFLTLLICVLGKTKMFLMTNGEAATQKGSMSRLSALSRSQGAS